MCEDERFGLIEKEIVVKEHNEPNEQISSLDISLAKKKSAILEKEREYHDLATKESLVTGTSEHFKEEVYIRCYSISKMFYHHYVNIHYSYKVSEQLPLPTKNEEQTKVVLLNISESVDIEESPSIEDQLPLRPSKSKDPKSSIPLETIEQGLMDAEQCHVETSQRTQEFENEVCYVCMTFF